MPWLMQIMIVAILFSPAVKSEQPIELHDAADVADIEMLDHQLDQLVAKVRQCTAAGLASLSDCYCYYPAKLASTQRVYSQLLAKHPEWEDSAILWWDDARAYRYNLNLGGLKAHIGQPCT